MLTASAETLVATLSTSIVDVISELRFGSPPAALSSDFFFIIFFANNPPRLVGGG